MVLFFGVYVCVVCVCLHACFMCARAVCMCVMCVYVYMCCVCSFVCVSV